VLTVWCITVALAGVWWLGVPTQWLLGGGRPLSGADWVRAPFVGLAVAVLFLQNLVYLGLPVAQTAWVPWAVGSVLWVAFTRSGALRASIDAIPTRLLAAALMVYVVHGSGLVAVGARYYVGEGWPDQIHYAELAYFIGHFPFQLDLAHVGLSPCLAEGIALKSDRIGQSVLQAFLAVSSGTDPKTVFEPLILLAPALTFLAVHELAHRLGFGPRQSLATAAAATLLPAVASLHLESFLSHALGLPFLLLFPLALDDLGERPALGRALCAALLLAGTVAIYTEFTPFLILALLVSLGSALAVRPGRWRRIGWHLAVAGGAALLNPGYLSLMGNVVRRCGAPEACGQTYPWALAIEGWSRVWLGDLAEVQSRGGVSIVRFFTVGMTCLAYFGLWRAWCSARRRAAREGASEAWRTLAITTTIAAIAAAPVFVLALDDRHPYQVYKLLMSAAPLFALGLAQLPVEPAHRWRRLIALLPLTLMLLAGGAGTLRMVLHTSSQQPRPRSYSALMHSPDMRRLQDLLSRDPTSGVVIAHRHAYIATWASYFAREKRIRLCQPGCFGTILDEVLRREGGSDLGRCAAPAIIVTEPQQKLAPRPEGDLFSLWSGTLVQVWRADSPRWAVPLAVSNPNGLEVLDGAPFFWMGGGPTRIELLTGAPGIVTLSAHFLPGPRLPGRKEWHLLLRSSARHEQQSTIGGGTDAVSIPVPAGRTTLILEALDEPLPLTPGQPECRPMVVGVQGLSFQFQPASPPTPGSRP
jgi:hypothetical protein